MSTKKELIRIYEEADHLRRRGEVILPGTTERDLDEVPFIHHSQITFNWESGDFAYPIYVPVDTPEEENAFAQKVCDWLRCGMDGQLKGFQVSEGDPIWFPSERTCQVDSKGDQTARTALGYRERGGIFHLLLLSKFQNGTDGRVLELRRSDFYNLEYDSLPSDMRDTLLKSKFNET